MRPSYQTIIGSASVPVYGTWVPLSYNVLNFNACVSGIQWGAAGTNFTWEAQYTMDDPVFERPLRSASQSGTTITIVDVGGHEQNSSQTGPGGMYGHGLSAGDCVILKGLGSGMDGTYDVAAVTDNTTYTVTSSTSRTATAMSGARVTPLRVAPLPDMTTMRGARMYTQLGAGIPPAINPSIVTAVRPYISAWTSGNLDFIVLHAGMGT